MLLAKGRSSPEQTPVVERTQVVRVIEVPAATVAPQALGYGVVKPAKVWEAVAEVSGQVIEMHPQLKRGSIFLKDTVLARIDPIDYEIAVAQIEADIQSAQAELAELAVKEANTRASLAIEEDALELGERELERNRQLVDKGTISRSAFEEQQRNVLAQRQSVQSQKNAISLFPVERKLLEARLVRNEAQLQRARLDLKRTTISLPFDGRIAELNVERTEYIRQGEVLAVVDGIDVAEIEAQIPIIRMQGLVQPQERLPMELGPGIVEKVLGLSASVWLKDLQIQWRGRVTRVSDTIDLQTRTVGVIVEVDDPYRQAQPGIRPPLVKGMFLEVKLRGKPRDDVLVVPRAALHGRQVYVVGNDNRLELRDVDVGLVQADFIVIKTGLRAGEQVIVSDLVPAIEGMALEPVNDPDALDRLLRQAKGGET